MSKRMSTSEGSGTALVVCVVGETPRPPSAAQSLADTSPARRGGGARDAGLGHVTPSHAPIHPVGSLCVEMVRP